MNEPRPRALTDRVEALERRSRRLALAGAALLLALVALVTMGQARPGGRTVEAERFVVKDARGRPRALLGMDGDVSALNLYDRDGRARAALHVAADGTGRLGFYDRDGKSRVILDVAPDGVSTVGFYDREGKAHAQLQVAADGSPVLGFFDREGKPIWPGRLLLP
jgi:hypothetical protein